MLISNSVSVGVPEIPTAGLDALAFLMSQNHLNDVLVSLFSILFELGLDGVSNIFADGVEVGRRVLLPRHKFVLEDGLYELTSL